MENVSFTKVSLDSTLIDGVTNDAMVTILRTAEEFRNLGDSKMKKYHLIGKTVRELTEKVASAAGCEDEDEKRDYGIIVAGLIEMISKIEPQLSEKTRNAFAYVRRNGTIFVD